MRRVIVLILAFALLSITGCSDRTAGTAPISPTPDNATIVPSNTQTGSPEPTPPVSSPSPAVSPVSTPSTDNQWSSDAAGAALAAFKAVLDNQSEFYSIESKKNVLFDDFLTNEEILVTVFEPVKFTILDMDGDQIPEVVIALQPADMFEVLHYTKGEVEGSIYSNRQLGNLKADGTFSWSGSAFNWGFGKLTFEATHDFRTDDIGYMNEENNNGVYTMVYYIDNTPVTEDEYDHRELAPGENRQRISRPGPLPLPRVSRLPGTRWVVTVPARAGPAGNTSVVMAPERVPHEVRLFRTR